MRVLMLLLLFALVGAGCATHRVGLVHAAEGPIVLESMDGKKVRLVTLGDAAPIAHLDGHMLEVWGQRLFGAMRISKWRVDQGIHGLATWVGKLEAHGVQIGLHDRNSGGFYFVSEKIEDELAPHLGKQVLLEGYVDGPHRIQVLFYRVLARPDGDG